MAAPTDVRVEAQSITSTIVRWTYAGTASIAVYRSTDGVTYSEVTVTATTTRVPVGTTFFDDTGLAVGTKYWYKLSDDSGSTFSSVVTVYTMSCRDGLTDPSNVDLPEATGDTVDPTTFNELSQRVRDGLNLFRSVTGQTCVACIIDSALVIDCVDFANCNQVNVLVDSNINSITIANCDDSIQKINFQVPPGVTRSIGGWPKGLGFTGDEGFRAPIAGGTDGRTISADISGSSNKSGATSTTGVGGGGGGLGGGGSACTCVPGSQGQLNIKSCNPGNSLKCSSTKSLQLIACGGKPPYTWSNTGSVVLSKTAGTTTTITPPTNSAPGTAGTAYQNDCYLCNTCSGGGSGPDCSSVIRNNTALYGCNDQVLTCAGASGSCGSAPSASALSQDCPPPGAANSGGICPTVTTDLVSTCGASGGVLIGTCDKRSGAMIAAGCVPCGSAAAAATVSVLDSMGVTVTVVLSN